MRQLRHVLYRHMRNLRGSVMLVDIPLKTGEVYMVRHDANGTAVVTIPLEVLRRAYATYTETVVAFGKSEPKRGTAHV